MERNVDDIFIEKRIRQDLGDIKGLKESMKKYGLLNPIVITQDNILVAGHRRLISARELGWTSVPVKVIHKMDEADLIEIEIDENLHRKPFTIDERTDALLKLEKMRNPSFWGKIRKKIADFFRRIFKRKKRRA